MEKLKAIAYCRVSTLMQEEGRSLEFQIKKCQDFCEFQNYNLIEIIQDVESGGHDDREGFLKLRERVRAKAFDVLVVFESSRISRVTLTMLEFVLELQKNDIHFISISQPELNTTTPTGMLFFQIQSSLSEYERKQISVRVKSNKWARAKEGYWQGGKLPIGYKKDPYNNDNILVNEETAEIVKAMFNYYLKTQSLKKTANRFEKPLESMRWILTNPFYTGIFRYGKKENNINTNTIKINEDYQYFKGIHKAIIDNELFQKVQVLIKNKRKKVNYHLLFTGLITCECGGKYYSSNNGKNYLYRCTKCKKSILASKLEETVFKSILEMSELEELNDYNEKSDKYNIQIEQLKKLIVKDNNAREKNLLLFKNEIISLEELKKEIEKIDHSIKIKRDEIEELSNYIKSIEVTSKRTDNLNLLKEIIKNFTTEDREDMRKLFNLMINEIIILNKDKINKYSDVELKIILK